MRTPDQNVKEAMRNLPRAYLDWLEAVRDDLREMAERPRVTGNGEHLNGQSYCITQQLNEIKIAVAPVS